VKTAIIDRSLCDLRFVDEPVKSRSVVPLYCAALLETGVDFIEISVPALVRLPSLSASDNYIFRIKRENDVAAANALPFAYVSLSLNLSYLIPKINKPILLEVNVGNCDPLTFVRVVSEHIDLTQIALLRLVCDFQQNPTEFDRFVTEYRLRYATPLDICPLDNSLEAVSQAVTAYASNVNSITLAFGGGDDKDVPFAPLEDFLITLATGYRILLSSKYIAGICKAMSWAQLFSDIKTQNLLAIMQAYHMSSKVIHQVDRALNQAEINQRVRSELIRLHEESEAKTFRNIADRQLDELPLDESVAEYAAHALRKSCIEICGGGNSKKQDFSN
jgi:hypothetical protein